MNEVKLKVIAYQVYQDDTIPFNSKSKILARGILAYFDPDFFFKSMKEQVREVRIKLVKGGEEN